MTEVLKEARINVQGPFEVLAMAGSKIVTQQVMSRFVGDGNPISALVKGAAGIGIYSLMGSNVAARIVGGGMIFDAAEDAAIVGMGMLKGGASAAGGSGDDW